jgi:hypothetical protein
MNKENDIDKRLTALEKSVVDIQNAMRPYQEMFQRDDYKVLIERVEELQLLVLGETRVGAKPLRMMVDEVYTAYSEYTKKKRRPHRPDDDCPGLASIYYCSRDRFPYLCHVFP